MSMYAYIYIHNFVMYTYTYTYVHIIPTYGHAYAIILHVFICKIPKIEPKIKNIVIATRGCHKVVYNEQDCNIF